MENGLALNVQQIVVIKGSIEFNEYESIKRQALELAEQIERVEVNEDNIKQSKKLLAAVNKRLKELEDKRINVKKTMLEPYQVFEEQIKEIVKIVKDADAEVREQVKYLEEFDRLQKEELLRGIFQQRVKLYAFHTLVGFYDFLKPEYLNKTSSINVVEKEMIDFLEKIEADLKTIKGMTFYSQEQLHELVSAYFDVFDLGQAIDQVNKEKQRRREIEASDALKKQPTEDKIAFLVSVKIYNQKELKLLELILKEHDFEFITEKVVF